MFVCYRVHSTECPIGSFMNLHEEAPTSEMGPSCLVCASTMRPWLQIPDSSWAKFGGSYGLFWCDGCAFGRVHPVPSWEKLSKHYRNYYTHSARPQQSRRSLLERVRVNLAWRVDHGQPLSADTVRKVLPASGSVCDLGCGDGLLLKELAERGVTVVGVEPDPVARRAAPPEVPILEGSAENLPALLRLDSFDAVVMSH